MIALSVCALSSALSHRPLNTGHLRGCVHSCDPLPSLPRGTHGYMAPEVLQKGTSYDSSADWFSLGCMLFKLLRG